jgi:hypothetical protein
MGTLDSLASLMLAEHRAAMERQLRERTLERESARSRAAQRPGRSAQAPRTPCVDGTPARGST